MKRFFLLLFLLCSFAAYGQNADNPDLIVTITGDSLHCKIIEVTAERIQFRFGPGTIIPINRNEVRSYHYYFAPATPAVAANTNTRPNLSAHDVIILRNGAEIKAKVTEIALLEIKYKRFENLDGPVVVVPKSDVFAIVYENGTCEEFEEVTPFAKGHTRFYAGLVVGSSGKDYPIYGFNAAYFFNRQIGVGFVFHQLRYNHDDYHYQETFFGPVFFGHWGRSNGKFFFPTNIGLGVASYNSSDYIKEPYLGFFISQGAAYRPIRSVSIGVNLEMGAAFNFMSGFAGVSLGLNFHF